MANLHVDYNEMLQQANNLRSKKEQINQELTSLANQINNLVTSGFVTDSASGAFAETYGRFTQGATQTIGALEDIAASLQNMASTLQQTDEQLAQQARS